MRRSVGYPTALVHSTGAALRMQRVHSMASRRCLVLSSPRCALASQFNYNRLYSDLTACTYILYEPPPPPDTSRPHTADARTSAFSYCLPVCTRPRLDPIQANSKVCVVYGRCTCRRHVSTVHCRSNLQIKRGNVSTTSSKVNTAHCTYATPWWVWPHAILPSALSEGSHTEVSSSITADNARSKQTDHRSCHPVR